jgi:hypothetical protein
MLDSGQHLRPLGANDSSFSLMVLLVYVLEVMETVSS